MTENQLAAWTVKLRVVDWLTTACGSVGKRVGARNLGEFPCLRVIA